MLKTTLKLYKLIVFGASVFLFVSILNFYISWLGILLYGLLALSLVVSISHRNDISAPGIAPLLSRQYFKTKFRIMEVENGHSFGNPVSIRMTHLFQSHHIGLKDSAVLFLLRLYLAILYHLVVIFQKSKESFHLLIEELSLVHKKSVRAPDNDRAEMVDIENVKKNLDKGRHVKAEVLERLYEKLFILHSQKQKRLKLLFSLGMILVVISTVISTMILNLLYPNVQDMMAAVRIEEPIVENFRITGYSSARLADNTAIFRWSTNEESDSAIHAVPLDDGRLDISEVEIKSDAGMTMAHEIRFENLNPSAIYNLELVSRDIAGNIATERVKNFSLLMPAIRPSEKIRSAKEIIMREAGIIIDYFNDEPEY